MAGELRHKDAISGRVREDEYEHIRQHILNDQEKDDIVVALTASQLGRLAVAASRIIGKKAAGDVGALTAAEVLTIINVAAGADVTGDNAPQAHKDLHDPEDGSDPVDTAAPVQVGSANAIGSSHSLTRADHVHEREHAIYVDASAVSAIEAAGLTFVENKGIILDALLSVDEKWSGISEIGTMGYAATVGDLVYLAVADTKWELADADADTTSKGKLGLVLATVSEDATCQVLLYGKMRSAAFPAFTVGAPVHVGTTAGDVVVTAPTGTGKIVRIIGYGNTAEDLFFCPDNTYVELA